MAPGAGPASQAGSIASYMSPYQQQVMDASLAEFDRNAAIQNQGLRDQAISHVELMVVVREGVMAAEAMRGNQGMNRASASSTIIKSRISIKHNSKSRRSWQHNKV